MFSSHLESNKQMKPLFILLLNLSMLLSGALAHAGDPRELGWEDLIPADSTFDDPFAALDENQLYNLTIVARHRQQLAGEQAVADAFKADADRAETELEQAGIDIDGLLARRAEITEKRRARAQETNIELDRTTIRLPGYMLPLEFNGTGVTEFLLVPWVGACIHTPPPPPNQIVHVVLDADDAFQSSGLYEPVWIEGEMRARKATQNLYMTDGSSDIDIGYRLQAKLVEKYVQ
jgi:hypothetical protein